MISAKGLCLTAAALGAALALAAPPPAAAAPPPPTRIARVQLYSLPQQLSNQVTEKLTFVGCGGPGRLLVPAPPRR